MLLSAENIGVRYGGIAAAEDVSLQISEGEIVGLIGPNGAGKSTVIDTITGFTSRHAGSVELDGSVLDGLQPHQISRLGLARTFQSLELFDDLTVRENLDTAGRAAGRKKDLLERVVDMFGLAPWVDSSASDLPQGYRRIVAVARAVCCGPKVLLLDEPGGGLDSNETEQLREQIQALRGIGIAVLLVDHNMSLVLSICDRVTVMNFGRVIASGTPDAVRRDPAVLDAYLGGIE